jgi:hypothetical protein
MSASVTEKAERGQFSRGIFLEGDHLRRETVVGVADIIGMCHN